MVKVTERKLGREGNRGQVFLEDKHIEIDPRQKPKEWLSTLVHELLHLAFPGMTEGDIMRAEKVVASGLWKSGIRRVHVK